MGLHTLTASACYNNTPLDYTMILCLPRMLHTSCSSMHPMHLKPFWGHAAISLVTSYVYFGQTLCSDVIALHSETQTPHLRPAEDQRQAGKVTGCLGISLALCFPIIRPIYVFQSLLYYYSKQYSTHGWQSRKGMKTAGKEGVACFGNWGRKLCSRF